MILDYLTWFLVAFWIVGVFITFMDSKRWGFGIVALRIVALSLILQSFIRMSLGLKKIIDIQSQQNAISIYWFAAIIGIVILFPVFVIKSTKKKTKKK